MDAADTCVYGIECSGSYALSLAQGYTLNDKKLQVFVLWSQFECIYVSALAPISVCLCELRMEK